MAEDPAGFDPGFVLDEASGLYFHSSSGFYHDANAGWYYNTNDGVYYKFEEGTYVPIAATTNSGNVVPGSETNDKDESTDVEVKEPRVSSLQESGILESAGEVTHESAALSGSLGEGNSSEGDTPNGLESDLKANIGSLNVGFPLWYYDYVRSIYWYYDKETSAYHQYHEETRNGLGETTVEREITAATELLQQGQMGMEESGGGMENLTLHETSQHEDYEDNFKPTSGWIEETLIDLYLRGYPNDSTEKDDGPWITSADIFSDGSPRNFSREKGYQETLHSRNRVSIDDLSSSGDVNYDRIMVQAGADESDEGSEELEEGEWVPDEPLRIIDGSLFIEGDQALENRRDDDYIESRNWAEPDPDDRDYDGDLEDGELEDGEIEQENGDTIYEFTGEQAMEAKEGYFADNGQRMEEEQWQAQFGQVVTGKARKHIIPGSIDLWDWMIVEMEPKIQNPGKITKKLVGRITSSVTKLVSASSGLIRTSIIRAVELDFVKVSSGKVYRLRRPSIKHLKSVGAYDSSNPTKDWGFPVLGLSLQENSEDPSLENGTRAIIERRTDSLVSKPFVPNTGHWKFQGLAPTKTKKGRAMPAALLASKYLSPEEILLNEQRKQKYRDRAAERRTLHGGFGTGPGQKGLTPQEEEKLDAENAAGLEGALKKASFAASIGSDNVGKRMLEGMGWKEGETLGVEGGLAAPIQAQGNDGRAGLGFR